MSKVDADRLARFKNDCLNALKSKVYDFFHMYSDSEGMLGIVDERMSLVVDRNHIFEFRFELAKCFTKSSGELVNGEYVANHYDSVKERGFDMSISITAKKRNRYGLTPSYGDMLRYSEEDDFYLPFGESVDCSGFSILENGGLLYDEIESVSEMIDRFLLNVELFDCIEKGRDHFERHSIDGFPSSVKGKTQSEIVFLAMLEASVRTNKNDDSK